MTDKSFFAKLIDGTYLRRLLGIKLYGEISNITGFDKSTGQMVGGVEQFRAALDNLNFALSNRSLTRESIVQVTITTSNGPYALANWEEMSAIWKEFFGTLPYLDATAPAGTVIKPGWALTNVPEIPGGSLIPGAPTWLMLSAKLEYS